MATYIKKENDAAYRIISLSSISTKSEFHPFSFVGDTVNYGDGKILEIKHTDGTTELVSSLQEKEEILYKFNGNKLVLSGVSTAHLFVHPIGQGKMAYGVPEMGEADHCLIDSRTEYELQGDKYFQLVYVI